MNNNIILDLANCGSREEIYETIGAAFDFPYKFGHNADALYDAMSYYWDDCVNITVKGIENMPPQLSEYMDIILGVFRDINAETPNVTFEISD